MEETKALTTNAICYYSDELQRFETETMNRNAALKDQRL